MKTVRPHQINDNKERKDVGQKTFVESRKKKTIVIGEFVTKWRVCLFSHLEKENIYKCLVNSIVNAEWSILMVHVIQGNVDITR